MQEHLEPSTTAARTSTVTVGIHGFRIQSPLPSSVREIADEVFRQRVYTPPWLGITPGDVVVDIGANVGVFCLYAAAQGAGAIFCAEPFPDNLRSLRHNVKINTIRGVTVAPTAVSDRTGTTQLYLSDVSAGHLVFDHNIHGSLHDSVEVTTTTLPQLMRQWGLRSADFLKLDCEGAEGMILASTPDDELRRFRKIALEFHDNVSSLHHDQLRERLARAGYFVLTRWDGSSPFGYLYAARR